MKTGRWPFFRSSGNKKDVRKQRILNDYRVVQALIRGINILTPGVCVALSDGEKGIVLVENKEDILKPMILYFRNNNIINLNHEDVSRDFQVKDIMKTMDNRYVIDREILERYKQEYK
jgi:hypothetical protein